MTEAKLVISGPATTREAPLDPKGTILGRAPNCDIVLDDAAVSRLHARISQDPFGRWIVEDLESHNGVFVDGQRVKTRVILPNQQMRIRNFLLCLVDESDQQIGPDVSIRETIRFVDDGSGPSIVSYWAGESGSLAPPLIQHLNEFTECLVQLTSPSDLYVKACSALADKLNALVTIVRLPTHHEPLPQSPEILACHFRTSGPEVPSTQAFHFHLSKRVLEAVRSRDTPVMASSEAAADQDPGLTIADTSDPHVVFAAHVNNLGETIDVLYCDVPGKKSPEGTFYFIEAAARQIHLAQQHLFVAELRKQETALKEANAQLLEKDRIKDEYVLRVTHDIKGHLGAIQSCLSLATNGTLGTLAPQQLEVVGRAFQRTLQLTGFVKDLLNLTRMRLSGRTHSEAFAVADCISKSLANIAEKAGEKKIAVTSEVELDGYDIVGDEVSFTEMLTNLLFNAVTYTPENRSVTLDGRCQDEWIQIQISDTGIGIPADEVGHVFDEFFRATNARRSEKDGTGLGLAIVKQIVERHGGKITVSSREGEGTTFCVVVPKNDKTSVCR